MLKNLRYDPFKVLPTVTSSQRDRFSPITVTEYLCAKQYSKIAGYTPTEDKIERSCLTLRNVPVYDKKSPLVTGGFVYSITNIQEVLSVSPIVKNNSIPNPSEPAYTIKKGSSLLPVPLPDDDTSVPDASYCVDPFPVDNDDLCKGTGIIVLPTSYWGLGVTANRRIFEVTYQHVGSKTSSNNISDIQGATKVNYELSDDDKRNLKYLDAPTTGVKSLIDVFSAGSYLKKFFGFTFNINTNDTTDSYLFISFFDIMKITGNDDYFNFAFSNGMRFNQWGSTSPPFFFDRDGSEDVSSNNVGTVGVHDYPPTLHQDVINTEIQKIALDKVAGVYFRLKFNIPANISSNFKVDTVTFVQYEPKQYGNNYLYRDTEFFIPYLVASDGGIPKTPISQSLREIDDDPLASDIAGTFLRRIDFGKENITPLQFTDNINIQLGVNLTTSPTTKSISRFIVSKIRTYTRSRKVLNSVIYRLFQGKSMINFNGVGMIGISANTINNPAIVNNVANVVPIDSRETTGLYTMPELSTIGTATSVAIASQTWGSKYVRLYSPSDPDTLGNSSVLESRPSPVQDFANAYLYFYR